VKPKNRAVSPVIATLLLILIAIAAGVIVYAYVVGFIGSATQNTSVQQSVISIDSVGTNAGRTQVNFYVRNVASTSTTLSTAYLLDTSGTVLATLSLSAVTLTPGQVSAQQTIPSTPLSPALTAGTLYSLKVVTADGSATITNFKA